MNTTTSRGTYWLPKSADEHRIAALVSSKLSEHGLVGWTVIFSRERNRLGYCNYNTKEICISRRVILTSWEEAVDTALHEVAHAIVGPGKGHGLAWKNAAALLGAKTRAAAVGYVNRDEAGKTREAKTSYGLVTVVMGKEMDIPFNGIGKLRIVELSRKFFTAESAGGQLYKLPVDILHPNYGKVSKIPTRKVTLKDRYGRSVEITIGETNYTYRGHNYVAVEAARRYVTLLADNGQRIRMVADHFSR